MYYGRYCNSTGYYFTEYSFTSQCYKYKFQRINRDFAVAFLANVKLGGI